MPDKDAATPRVFLVRHGETAWTLSGRFTSHTDLPLTPHGEAQVRSSAAVLVSSSLASPPPSSVSATRAGPGIEPPTPVPNHASDPDKSAPNPTGRKLIAPERTHCVFVSPRLRAWRTARLMFGCEDVQPGPEGVVAEMDRGGGLGAWRMVEEEGIREWEYGDYEGLRTAEIRALRAGRGLDGEGRGWDIWRDGCERGESPGQVTERLDRVIRTIRDVQRGAMYGERPADVVLVAHGHILRAFTKRWLGYPMEFPLSMMIEPGGIGILSYQHHSVDEPAFLLGMGIPASEADDTLQDPKC